MHNDGRWAKQLIALQEADGKWGCFHSLSKVYNASVTTEQALRRLERLGYTMEDSCIQKAVSYMSDCLSGKKTIPDRAEKWHDWDVFTQLMLAAWIRRFTTSDPAANLIAERWGQIIRAAFTNGHYQHDAYVTAYQRTWGKKPAGGRLKDFSNFYLLSLLRDGLDPSMQAALIDYILDKQEGIYYIYEKQLATLPSSFQSKEASRYLAAVELLADYPCAAQKLYFVRDWLLDHQNANGQWDMGPTVKDGIYFPLSDSWRRKQVREADCTERIEALLNKLSS